MLFFFSSGSQLTLPVDLKNILEKQFSKTSRAAHQVMEKKPFSIEKANTFEQNIFT
jgi:GTP1/Obg family GTP-binding protein